MQMINDSSLSKHTLIEIQDDLSPFRSFYLKITRFALTGKKQECAREKEDRLLNLYLIQNSLDYYQLQPLFNSGTDVEVKEEVVLRELSYEMLKYIASFHQSIGCYFLSQNQQDSSMIVYSLEGTREFHKESFYLDHHSCLFLLNMLSSSFFV